MPLSDSGRSDPSMPTVWQKPRLPAWLLSKRSWLIGELIATILIYRKQERLDWMYQGGMVAKQEAEKRQDAQMLGEKEIAIQAEEPTSKVRLQP